MGISKKSQPKTAEYWSSWRYKILRLRIDIVYHVVHPFKQVKRIIEYISLLWRDEDWDWMYIFNMLKYKIERTRKYIGKYGHNAKRSEDVASMQQAEFLMKRMMHDNYMTKEWSQHRRKYPMKFEKLENGHFRSKDYGKRANAEGMKIANKGAQLYERDWEALWKLLKKKMRSWWD